MISDTDSLNTLNEISTIEDDEDDINDTKSIIILPMNVEYNNYYTNNKKTTPFLTKFEKTKLIGIRAQMISSGSQPLVDVPSNITCSIDIAELEFENKCIPLFIKRYIGDNDYEIWRPEDMINI